MKSIIHKITAVAAVLVAVASSIPQSQAANIRLRGSGYFELGNYDTFSRYGKEQSGRYDNLGRDYYHKTEYGMDYVTNASGFRSGSLSYEFWAMPYYGAESGIVLMTRGLSRLAGNESYVDLYKYGWGVSLDRYRYPEQNIWEYTSSGWRFRDSLSFTRKTLL